MLDFKCEFAPDIEPFFYAGEGSTVGQVVFEFCPVLILVNESQYFILPQDWRFWRGTHQGEYYRQYRDDNQ